MASKENKQKEMEKYLKMQERCEMNDECSELMKMQEFFNCLNDSKQKTFFSTILKMKQNYMKKKLHKTNTIFYSTDDSPTSKCAIGGLMAACIVEVYPETLNLIRDMKSWI